MTQPDHKTNRTAVARGIYLVMAASTLLGIGHHIDHIIRGNHVGWPITSHVNPFTYSLAIYPLIASVCLGSLYAAAAWYTNRPPARPSVGVPPA